MYWFKNGVRIGLYEETDPDVLRRFLDALDAAPNKATLGDMIE